MFFRFLSVGLAASLAAAPAFAAVMTVAPVTLEFQPGRTAIALQVSDPSAETMQVQIRVFRWTQESQEDVYTPTRDIVFSPPQFTLAAGAKQTVRLVLRDSPTDGREAAYRVFVDQIPENDKAGALQMPVRMVLPLFVETGGGGSDLHWRLERDKATGAGRLVVANGGARRAKLRDIAYLSDGKARPIAQGLAGYVLAGQERAWPFKLPERATALEVSATADDGQVKLTLPVATP